MPQTDFRTNLTALLNSYSMENGSNTPDFILAEYLLYSLAAFDTAMNAREKWYGRERVAEDPQAEQRALDAIPPPPNPRAIECLPPPPLERHITGAECVAIAAALNAQLRGCPQIDPEHVKRIALGLDRCESHPTWLKIDSAIRALPGNAGADTTGGA